MEAQKTNHAVHDDPLLERAAHAGFELVTRVTDTGQVIWEWRNGLAPRPQFLSERIAVYWMYGWLAQQDLRQYRR